jgi:SAM-dependent methyltransferase
MDVVELREFYVKPLGQTAQRLLRKALQPMVKCASDQIVLGLGYAVPYLDGLLPGHQHALSFMLARQGVEQWPHEGDVASALVDEFDLPLLESTVDLALIVHGLELTDAPLEMLQEIWRVMAPQGRLLLVVPNRRSLWAVSEATPFGHGQPFSKRQLADLLKQSQFSVLQWQQALVVPPVQWSFAQKLAPALEAIARPMMPNLSGVLVVEAVKQVYAFSSGKRARRLVPRFRQALLPAPQRNLSGAGKQHDFAFAAIPPIEKQR